MKLNCQDLFDRVWHVMKIGQENYVTDRISAIYAKNDYKLSWSIGLSTVCDGNKSEQRHDQLYGCGLHKKWYWTILIDRIECW